MKKNLLLFFFLILSYDFLHAASFNCDLAKSNVEKMICDSPTLSLQDENMGSLYSSLIKIYSNAIPIRIWQKSWLIGRNDCKDSKCLEDAYIKRIAILKSALAADAATKKWTGYYSRYINKSKDTDSSNILLVALDNSKVFVEGHSIWVGNVKTGNVNLGEIIGIGNLKGSVVTESVKDEFCSSRLILTANNSLLVDGEQSGCGGMNVTFKGEYFK